MDYPLISLKLCFQQQKIDFNFGIIFLLNISKLKKSEATLTGSSLACDIFCCVLQESPAKPVQSVGHVSKTPLPSISGESSRLLVTGLLGTWIPLGRVADP
jgi:hypothetical protein